MWWLIVIGIILYISFYAYIISSSDNEGWDKKDQWKKDTKQGEECLKNPPRKAPEFTNQDDWDNEKSSYHRHVMLRAKPELFATQDNLDKEPELFLKQVIEEQMKVLEVKLENAKEIEITEIMEITE